jgi:hypothetical protein
VTASAKSDLGYMNTRTPHRNRFSAFAAAVGPREVADLARVLPWLETDELARILTSMPEDERSLR